MARPLRRWVGAAAVVLALVTVTASPSARADGRVELMPSVQQSLLHLQELWIEWLANFNQGNAERSGELLNEILVTSRQLGMETLPDLADAALAAGVAQAESGEMAKARLALAAAERLAPGQPENAFARAEVEALAGRPFRAAASWLGGHVRILLVPQERRLRLGDGIVKLLYLVLLAGVVFVALLFLVHGRRLMAELAAFVGRGMPAWLAVPLVALLLLWPLLLPAGVAWLAFYWSVLLFAYVSTGERLVLALVWLIAGLVPLASSQARQMLAIELAPPVQALEQVVDGKLYGSLFTDLALIQELLPEEPAVDHLLADLHRRLGQWERARTLYLRVLEAEPENATALVDLGSYYFYKGDYGTALSRYREAIEVAPENGGRALAYFNLSQTLSVEYLFEEGGEALEQAKKLAGATGVERWMAETGEGSVLNADGGFARRREVRARLADVLAGNASEAARTVTLVRQTWSLLVSLGLLLGALGFVAVRRRLRDGDGVPRTPPLRPGRWTRALIPGLTAAIDGRALAAFGASLLLALVALVAWHADIGFTLPLGFAQAQPGPWVALALLALLVLTRAWLFGRREA